MTTFKHSIQACGLSQREAAEFTGKSLMSIKDYCRGKSNPPPEVWAMLSELYADIEDVSDHAAEVMDLEGIDFRAYNNISVSGPPEIDLPEPAARIAGAIALLKAIADNSQ